MTRMANLSASSTVLTHTDVLADLALISRIEQGNSNSSVRNAVPVLTLGRNLDARQCKDSMSHTGSDAPPPRLLASGMPAGSAAIRSPEKPDSSTRNDPLQPTTEPFFSAVHRALRLNDRAADQWGQVVAMSRTERLHREVASMQAQADQWTQALSRITGLTKAELQGPVA